MVLEHALLPVRPGEEEAFLRAFDQAQPLIAATPGFLGMTLSRCVERPSTFLLLVRWVDVEAHERGFRGSDRYPEWSRLLHGFYDPFPEVLHLEEVRATSSGSDGPRA